MLVKIKDGFYLNSRHIIALRVNRILNEERFMVSIEYTPHSMQDKGLYQRIFPNKIEAELFLQALHQEISKP